MGIIIGIDEAGRGAWAGPLCVSALAIDDSFSHALRDSKKLSPKKRAHFFEIITNEAIAYDIQTIDAQKIDEINVLQATLLGMHQALEGIKQSLQTQDLWHAVGACIIDGTHLPPNLPTTSFEIRCMPSADDRVRAVSGASIVAKVHRDALMHALDQDYPEYGFEAHKGYGTKMHREKLHKHGLCPFHRRSFAPMKNLRYNGGV